ncbi:MAG: VWA domain-containing protein [Pedosphaera sp.]|nr:VWA domain-containing protein [Pedosphaera sp.]
MNFIAPLFLAGAAAVAFPIIFHLIRRTTKEEMIFSSLMFLQPTPPRVTRRSKLDHLLLLILRCLVLGLLALGFARPFLKRPVDATPAQEGGSKVIVLVDASASMRRQGLWRAATDKAEEILRKLNSADQAAVMVFDQRLRSVVNFAQWASAGVGERAALGATKLREAEPSWGMTALGSALIGAVESFEESDKRDHATGLRRIVLISDFQEGVRLEGLQGYEWPKGVEVVAEQVGPRRSTNAGLQITDASEDASQQSGEEMRVRVTNSSDASREQFQLQWKDGEKVGEVYVPPGQSRTVAVKADGKNKSGQLTLSGDDADFDNALYLIPRVTEQIRVLFLGDDAEKDPTQSLYYLKRAFPETTRQKIEIISRSSTASLTAADFVGVKVAVIVGALPADKLKIVQDFVRDGNIALLAIKGVELGQTLAKLGGVDSVPIEEAKVGNYAMFGQIDFQHPLFAPFADPRFSDFTKIHIWKYRRVDIAHLKGSRALIRFDNKEADPAMFQTPVGKGSLLVLTFGWFPTDSQFALSSKFVPLLHSVLEQAGAVRGQSSQFAVGDPVDLSALKLTQAVSVTKPDGTEATVAVGEKFNQTTIPGIYTVASVTPPYRFAVNLSPEESRTAQIPMETLEKLAVPLKALGTQSKVRNVEQTRKREVLLKASEIENRQKLWRWLIVAALVVLMTETWLAGRVMRRGAMTTEAA